MHELSLALNIIDIVRDEMDRHRLSTVETVVIRLGALSGVDPEALKFGFEAGLADSPLAGTRLDIVDVPVEARCRACGREFSVDDYVFLCPFCDSPSVEIVRGQEIQIDHLVGG